MLNLQSLNSHIFASSFQVEASLPPLCENICFLLTKDTHMNFPEVVAFQKSTNLPHDPPSSILIALKPITRPNPSRIYEAQSVISEKI